VILGVGRTVDFDDEPGFPAEEVHDIGTDRGLADELEILKSSVAQVTSHLASAGMSARRRERARWTCRRGVKGITRSYMRQHRRAIARRPSSAHAAKPALAAQACQLWAPSPARRSAGEGEAMARPSSTLARQRAQLGCLRFCSRGTRCIGWRA
jgi:hypothetical protein